MKTKLVVFSHREHHDSGLSMPCDHLGAVGKSVFDNSAELILGFLKLPFVPHGQKYHIASGLTSQNSVRFLGRSFNRLLWPIFGGFLVDEPLNESETHPEPEGGSTCTD